MVLEMEMSKTYQYRKVMKPMLERKRRARINKCLDELKDIMVECLTQEGEHITRLEKADILELTVEHMKKLKQRKQLRINQDPKISVIESFRAGYVHAANEVSKALASLPGVSVDLGTQLMSHLGHRLNYLQVVTPAVQPKTPIFSPPPQRNLAVAAAASVAVPSTSPTNLFCNNSLNYFEDVSRSAIQIVTPPPSDCSSDRGNSPTPSESSSVWRPW